MSEAYVYFVDQLRKHLMNCLDAIKNDFATKEVWTREEIVLLIVGYQRDILRVIGNASKAP